MVLPAPPAAEGQAAQAWLTRIRGLLALGRGGTMIIVRHGQPWSPWPVQALIEAMGERAELLLDARRILDIAPDAIVVLLARRIDLDWLNVNRPHFAGRRVLVWVPSDAWMEYRQRAPDFFDWASHVVEAPPILPRFGAAAVERAMLHLHAGQVEPAMDILRPYLDDLRDPPRAQQLWILALRMQGRTLEANEQIQRWTTRGLDPSLFELRTSERGTPREWLEQTMASDFDAVLAAALAPE